MVIVWVNDFFFGSKIETEARTHNAPCYFVDNPHEAIKAVEESASSSVMLIDLDMPHRTFETIRTLKARFLDSELKIVGFMSHVQVDLADRARLAGCDLVMPRSLFAARLPEIFELDAVIVR